MMTSSLQFRNLVLLVLSCMLSGGMQSCAPSPQDSLQGTLVITGSSTVEPLIRAIAKRYEIEHPNVEIEIEAGGSGRGLTDAHIGKSNIGMVSRALTDGDPDVLDFPIARDGISILLHRDNPVAQLTNEQIVAIFTDEINSWQEVGGTDTPMVVVNKAQGHATLELFTTFFNCEADQIQADVIIKGNEEAIAVISENPGAIGYVSIGTAEYEIIHGTPIQLLPIDGVLATIANVANNTFPLTRPLNLVTHSDPTFIAQDFITYARSDAVADLIKEQAFVPLPHHH